jgi:hypothetical protein
MRERRNDDGTFKGKDEQKASAGRKGGKKTGASKARTGATNGRHDPTAERRPCCGVHAKRSHAKTCPNHRLNRIHAIRTARKENIEARNYEDSEYFPVAAVEMMVRGCEGACVVCKTPMKVLEARKVNKEDINSPQMRVVCAKCV